MTSIRHEHRTLELACSLSAPEAGGRLADWENLRRQALRASEPVPGGARLWLPEDARPAAEDLARQEAACCGFLDLALGPVEEGRFSFEVTSLRPEALTVIGALAGPLTRRG